MTGDSFDETQRPATISFMTDAMVRLETCLKDPLVQIQRKLRAKSQDE
jgi:hypothetical protein